MTKFLFKGEEVQLGRFGFVKKGDVLLLTEQETTCIIRDQDKRFEVYTPKPGTPKPKGNLIPITDKMTGAEREAAEKANKIEAQRLDQLAKANDENTVIVEEIRAMTYDGLVELAERMNDEAKSEVVSFSRKTSKSDLIRLILEARRRGLGALEEETEKETADA